jgi:hypothetical protein
LQCPLRQAGQRAGAYRLGRTVGEDFGYLHPVFGQGARFVGADNRNAAHRLRRPQWLDDGVLAR